MKDETIFESNVQDSSIEPMTPELIDAWESQYDLRLPQKMRELYCLQNGGVLRQRTNCELTELNSISLKSENGLAPLAVQKNRKTWQKSFFEYLPEDQVGACMDVIGDPCLIVPLEGDGHYYFALDYNACGKTGEPSIINLELEDIVEKSVHYDSFYDFIKNNRSGKKQIRPTQEQEEIICACKKRFKIIPHDPYEIQVLIDRYKQNPQKSNLRKYLQYYFEKRLNRRGKISNISGFEALILADFFDLNGVLYDFEYRPSYSWRYACANKDVSDLEHVFGQVAKHFKKMIQYCTSENPHLQDYYICNVTWGIFFYQSYRKPKKP